MQTRNKERSEGGSIPFTKKELEEPLFTEHLVHAEIHNSPTERTNSIESLPTTELLNTENNTQGVSLETQTLPLDNIESSDSQIIIPPHLLQIINNLAGDCENLAQTVEEEDNENNQEDDQNDKATDDDDSDEEDEEENLEEEDDNDCIKDVDATYNELDTNETTYETENQIVTRGQKHSVVNSRDQIFMQKENYLYFLTADGKPCDEGSKQLEKRNLISKIKESKVGNIEVIKRGNRTHLILICKENINEKLTKKTLLELGVKLRDILRKNPIKILTVAKTKQIDNIPWEEILNQIRESIRGTLTKLIICHGLVTIPEIERRKDIIVEAHSSKIGGHKGITKTYNRIRQNFYWDNIKADIRNYISQCLQCQTKKLIRVKTKQPMLITDTPFSSFEKISMDIVGPLSATSKGNSYILTIQDHLTKFSLAIPLKSITAIQVADALLKYFICIFGAPKIILTDQGTNFMSNMMKRFTKQFKIKQYRTTAFYPQANGALERSHLVLIEYLKQYVNKFTEWDELLEYATFSYNTSTHESTRYAPYELVFGKLARQPSSEIVDDANKGKTYDDYLCQLMTNIHTLQELARECLIASKLKSKYYYDRKINPQTFQINDQVFLLIEPKKGKLGDQYSGPHIITDIFPNGNIQILHKGKSKIVHPNKIRKMKTKTRD
jgi:hypothetical protein